MKNLKDLFESTLLIEAKKLMVLDTLAASESDKIKEVLDKDGIKYKQTGSILSLELDPKSPQAAVLRSHLKKIAKFDEIKEAYKGGGKSNFECMECGAKFSKKMPKIGEVKCPKCKSTDIELNEAKTKKKVRIHLSGQGSDAKYSIIDGKTKKDLMINIDSEEEARKIIKKKGWFVGAGITRMDESVVEVTKEDLVPGFTFFVISKDGRSLSRYKITGEKELNVGTVLEVKHAVIAGDKFKQSVIAKDFVLGNRGDLSVFKTRKKAMSVFKK